MIYVPNDNTYDKCYVVQSEGVIRGYDRQPSYNTIYNYRDYYITSNYIYRDGSGQWSNYSTLPICLTSDTITNDFYYRNDFDSICLVFLVFAIFVVFLPFKIFSRLFGRWLKC